MMVYAVNRSPPSRNQVITVPNLRPASPHSSSRSRSPRFQRVARNAITLIRRRKNANTETAVQLSEALITASSGTPGM